MGLFGRRRSREATDAARTMPDSPPCATGTCGDDCLTRDFRPREVNIQVTEVISNAPPEHAGWNGRYGWDSKYTLTVRRSPCEVLLQMKLKVVGDHVAAAPKDRWKSAIETKWNGKVKFVCPDRNCAGACGAGYPVRIEVLFIETGTPHYEITACLPGTTTSSAGGTGSRAGLGGTISMKGWGTEDFVDVTHEFGHMLGNPEEYFTTDGFDYQFGDWRINGFRDPGGGNMNNPDHDPASRNYVKILEQANLITGRNAACSLDPPAAQPTNPNPLPVPAKPAPPPAAPAPAAPAPAPATAGR